MATQQRNRGSGGSDYHPSSLLKDKSKMEDEIFDATVTFLREKAAECDCCKKRTGAKGMLSCQCLKPLRDDESGSDALVEGVATFIMYFSRLRKDDQQQKVMEWIRYSDALIGLAPDKKTSLKFILPVVRPEGVLHQNPLPTHFICQSSLMLIIGKGRNWWKTCQQAVESNTIPQHGLVGKPSNRAQPFTENVEADLHSYFAELKTLSEPVATRFVQEETGTGLREDEINLVELPPLWTKRRLFYRFCYHRGWRASTTARSGVTMHERDDDTWVATEQETQPVISWSTFLAFWKKHYPKLKIRKPSQDICADCHIMANKPKHRARSTTTNVSGVTVYAESDDSSSSSESKEEGKVEEDDNDEAVSAEVREREERIMKAALHVRHAQAQRDLFNEKEQEAISDQESNVPRAELRKTYVLDYAQNLEMPFFGDEQPGDTYYFTPLTVNLFGIVDCCRRRKHLYAFPYHEGQGRKGGNNVASLIMKQLYADDILNLELGPILELSLFMDNCGGQNKNRMVLRLALYLVEMGFVVKVNIIFLVTGHTKNHCDRMYNQLKGTYRRTNLYTMDKLVEELSKSQDVTITTLEDGDFKDYNSFLDKFYRRFTSGTVKKNHIFTIEKDSPTTMILREGDLDEFKATPQEMKKKKTGTMEER